MAKSNKLGNPTIEITTTRSDIASAECANRRQCVFAHTVDRQFKLGGKGYITIDANAFSMTYDGWRYQYHPPRPAVTYLRKFDKLGEAKGVEAARESLEPRKFTLTLLKVIPVTPKASPERKIQINTARRIREAQQKAAGTFVAPPTHARYAGI